MKTLKFTFLLMILTMPFTSYCQEPKYVYCQIIATQKLLSNKVTVELDFGQKMKFLGDNRLKDESGRAITFNTNVDAMNYLGRQGWEFIQMTMVEVPNGSSNIVYVTVMKKPFSELDEETKKEYLKG